MCDVSHQGMDCSAADDHTGFDVTLPTIFMAGKWSCPFYKHSTGSKRLLSCLEVLPPPPIKSQKEHKVQDEPTFERTIVVVVALCVQAPCGCVAVVDSGSKWVWIHAVILQGTRGTHSLMGLGSTDAPTMWGRGGDDAKTSWRPSCWDDARVLNRAWQIATAETPSSGR